MSSVMAGYTRRSMFPKAGAGRTVRPLPRGNRCSFLATPRDNLPFRQTVAEGWVRPFTVTVNAPSPYGSCRRPARRTGGRGRRRGGARGRLKNDGRKPYSGGFRRRSRCNPSSMDRTSTTNLPPFLTLGLVRIGAALAACTTETVRGEDIVQPPVGIAAMDGGGANAATDGGPDSPGPNQRRGRQRSSVRHPNNPCGPLPRLPRERAGVRRADAPRHATSAPRPPVTRPNRSTRCWADEQHGVVGPSVCPRQVHDPGDDHQLIESNRAELTPS